MALSDTKIKALKSKEKPYKVADGLGLYLLVNATGSKLWRLKYRMDGKEKVLALGSYPDTTLKKARIKRDEARTLHADGIDPAVKRKAEKLARNVAAENSLEAVAREWQEKFKTRWSTNHAEKILTRLMNDIFPWLGNRPVADIEPPELLETIRRIEKRGALDSAHRTLQTCGQVFRYAIATGRANRDISADLKGALPPVKKSHFSAITKPEELAKLMQDIKDYRGQFVTRIALTMLPYVFVRPGELRRAEWAEIDLDEKQWIIPAKKIKTRIDHIVPLADQVIALLEDIQPLTGHRQYIFPGARSPRRPMSENALLAALRNLGYTKEQMTPHGFRATARTLLDEELNYPPHLIEHQLAHAVKDANGRAYNRTAHLPQRREMMQSWADYLDSLTEDGNVTSFRNEA